MNLPVLGNYAIQDIGRSVAGGNACREVNIG